MSIHQDFLLHLGGVLKSRALEAVIERNAEVKGGQGRIFESGRVLAFNEVLSIMQQEASGFGIALSDLQLEDITPDRDVV